MLGRALRWIRRWGSGLSLDAFVFQGLCRLRRALMRAIDMLRRMKTEGRAHLPNPPADSSFIGSVGARQVLRGGHRSAYYELCVLSECTNACAPADVWGVGRPAILSRLRGTPFHLPRDLKGAGRDWHLPIAV